MVNCFIPVMKVVAEVVGTEVAAAATEVVAVISDQLSPTLDNSSARRQRTPPPPTLRIQLSSPSCYSHLHSTPPSI